MQSTATDPAKRIPKSIGTDTKLVGRFTLADLIVALCPGVAVVLVVQVILPAGLTLGGYSVQLLTLPLALAAIGLGGVFVSLTPTYTTSVAWLAAFVGFHRRSKRDGHEAAKADTHVERLHPERDAIERTDGVFVGLLRVDPPSMALATEAQWGETADAFADVLNTTVSFPIQIYSTTQRFPVEAYLDHYESRLSDPDVVANPRLARLIEEYVSWYGEELRRRRMTIRDHYVVVSVGPDEIRFDRDSGLGGLSRLPVVGALVAAWAGPHAIETRAAMFDELDARTARLERALREIDGCRARRLDIEDAVTVVSRFWTGREVSDIASRIRSTPVVGDRP